MISVLKKREAKPQREVFKVFDGKLISFRETVALCQRDLQNEEKLAKRALFRQW
ncbi:hypothetical protein KUL156_02420 [Alteromonas sp. KUL156]|nr:hypothetical protein KUL154_23580 [Alteromonas sp. KUL154]GFD97649.1 hypothetical protein KUL156_02420 [Alteromonas sp. KUL156]